MINAIVKFLLSFFKSSWGVQDYPLSLRRVQAARPKVRQPGSQPASARWRQPALWSAQIARWPQMFAYGHTRREAMSNLECRFNNYRVGDEPLPRPGTRAQTPPGSISEIEAYEILAMDFFKHILDTNYYNCVLSDSASLGDFVPDVGYHLKIEQRYGVDVSDIQSGSLVKILQRIWDQTDRA